MVTSIAAGRAGATGWFVSLAWLQAALVLAIVLSIAVGAEWTSPPW
jgi:hypothetical protein